MSPWLYQQALLVVQVESRWQKKKKRKEKQFVLCENSNCEILNMLIAMKLIRYRNPHIEQIWLLGRRILNLWTYAEKENNILRIKTLPTNSELMGRNAAMTSARNPQCKARNGAQNLTLQAYTVPIILCDHYLAADWTSMQVRY